MINRDDSPEAPASQQQAEQIAGLLETAVTMRGEQKGNLLLFDKDFGELPPELVDLYPDIRLAELERRSIVVSRRFEEQEKTRKNPISAGEIGSLILIQREKNPDGETLNRSIRFIIFREDSLTKLVKDQAEIQFGGQASDEWEGILPQERAKEIVDEHQRIIAGKQLAESMGLNQASAPEAEHLITFLSQFDALAEPAI